MKTLEGRIEEIVNTGKANMDGFTPEEALHLVLRLKNIGIITEYSGVKNEIEVVKQ